MTREEAFQQRREIRKVVKNWRAKDAWHDAVRDRYDDLFDYLFCSNCQDKDPGPWEMPPVPEGVEP
ncbi:MAG: hypothetical protein ACI4R9_05100 [Kiritimatiellia bacterium]